VQWSTVVEYLADVSGQSLALYRRTFADIIAARNWITNKQKNTEYKRREGTKINAIL